MKLPLYERVALLKDVPDQDLKKGDVVTTVDFLESPKPGIPNGYFVEAFDARGKTIAVFTVNEDDIEALTNQEVLHVRPIAEPAQPSQVLGETLAKSDSSVTSPSSTTLTIDLSNDVLEQKGITLDEAKLQLAIALFQQDFFSLGKASEFAGLHPTQFQKELALRQISVHYDVDEYQHDLDTLDDFTKSLPTYHEV